MYVWELGFCTFTATPICTTIGEERSRDMRNTNVITGVCRAQLSLPTVVQVKAL